MQVYLLRHGIAEEGRHGESDSARALTSEGRKKLRQVLQTASKIDVQPTLIITSPFKRAIQTAEIAKHMFDHKEEVLQSNALIPSSTPEQVWAEIRTYRNKPSLLLVGHNPLFSDLVRFLLHSPDLQIDFKKGALMRLDFERISPQPAAVLRWYLTAKVAGSQK